MGAAEMPRPGLSPSLPFRTRVPPGQTASNLALGTSSHSLGGPGATYGSAPSKGPVASMSRVGAPYTSSGQQSPQKAMSSPSMYVGVVGQRTLPQFGSPAPSASHLVSNITGNAQRRESSSSQRPSSSTLVSVGQVRDPSKRNMGQSESEAKREADRQEACMKQALERYNAAVTRRTQKIKAYGLDANSRSQTLDDEVRTARNVYEMHKRSYEKAIAAYRRSKKLATRSTSTSVPAPSLVGSLDGPSISKAR